MDIIEALDDMHVPIAQACELRNMVQHIAARQRPSASRSMRSAVVPAEPRPARLAAWASPPPGVQAFLARTPGLKLGGWSRAGQEE